MKLVIDSDICAQHNLTVEEFLFLILSKHEVDIPKLRDCTAAKVGIPDQKIDWKLYLSNEQSKLVNKILLDSDKTIKSQTERFKQLAKRLREQFPEGKKGNVYYWRDSEAVIVERLKAFAKKYGSDFDDDLAVDATRRYVESFNGDYTYMQLLKYFIMKNVRANGEVEEVSQLLSYMENKDVANVATGDWALQLK